MIAVGDTVKVPGAWHPWTDREGCVVAVEWHARPGHRWADVRVRFPLRGQGAVIRTFGDTECVVVRKGRRLAEAGAS